METIMGISYTNPDRLLRDAKRIKSHINSSTKLTTPISTAGILNAVAKLFQWSHWAELSAAANATAPATTRWHNLRRSEKLHLLQQTMPSFFQSLSASGVVLHEKQQDALQTLILEMLIPKEPKLPQAVINTPWLPRIFKNTTPAYMTLPERRQNEGIELTAPYIGVLVQHLMQALLTGDAQPGCFVICTQFDARHFEEAFLQAGYHVTFMGETTRYWQHSLSSERDPIGTMPMVCGPSLSVPPAHPASIESYFEHAIEQLKHSGSAFFREHLVIWLASIYCQKLRMDLQDAPLPSFRMLSLGELMALADTKPDAPFTPLIREYQHHLQGVAAEHAANAHECASTQLEIFMKALSTSFTKGVVDYRPSEGHVWMLILRGDESHAEKMCLAAQYRMLLDVWGLDGSRRGERAMAFIPNDRQLNLLTHHDKTFLFALHNRARLSTIFYGRTAEKFCDASTRVVVTERGYVFEDNT